MRVMKKSTAAWWCKSDPSGWLTVHSDVCACGICVCLQRKLARNVEAMQFACCLALGGCCLLLPLDYSYSLCLLSAAICCHLRVLLKNIADTFSSFLGYNSIHFCCDCSHVIVWHSFANPTMIAAISTTPGWCMKLLNNLGSAVMVTVAQFSGGRLVHTISLGKMNLIRMEIDVFVRISVTCLSITGARQELNYGKSWKIQQSQSHKESQCNGA